MQDDLITIPDAYRSPAEIARKFKVDDQTFETLVHKYCNDLSIRAQRGDPITGRDAEVDQVITIMLHRGRSNVALLGGAGTGKTALFNAIAQKIASGDVPRLLKDARVLELDWSLIGAGTDTRGEFEGRLIPLLTGAGERNDTHAMPKIIFCMDELHTIMRSCPASSASGVSDLLKPYLTVGNLQIIGATTEIEYEEHIRPDYAMDRRFQKIILKQPTEAETALILKNIRKGYEKYFNITISDEMCEATAKLATKYIRNRNNPDKSIMMLDGACARFVKDGHEGAALTVDYIQKAVAAEINVDPKAVV